MSTDTEPAVVKPDQKKHRPFRRAILRGLGIVLPPLLTVVVFLWAWHTIDSYVLVPLENSARFAICQFHESDIRDKVPSDADQRIYGPDRTITGFEYNGKNYVRFKGKWINQEVKTAVEDNPGEHEPTTPRGYLNRYVQIKYLKRQLIIPVFLIVFILILYLVGKFVAAGIGRMFWNLCEAIIHRLPIIRNVYSSVKQVTDFAFSEREVEYTRIVAVQYPCKGIWSMGFVTGESFLDIASAANEPVLSVLMPTSPMPATGFTITVPKSETIDLNITIDQAVQFCVSCGVVVPPHQQKHHSANLRKAAEKSRPKDRDGKSKDTPQVSIPSATPDANKTI